MSRSSKTRPEREERRGKKSGKKLQSNANSHGIEVGRDQEEEPPGEGKKKKKNSTDLFATLLHPPRPASLEKMPAAFAGLK